MNEFLNELNVKRCVTHTHTQSHTHHPLFASQPLATDLILLLVLQDSLQESPTLMAGGLLVKHACLDDLLVHI